MTETLTRSEFRLLEAAHGQTQRDLAVLAAKVDDNHADVTERIDQLRSDLQRATGTSERRLKAVEKTNREMLDHLALLTSKITEHDTRFDEVDARFDGVDTRFDGIDTRLDAVDTRLEGIDTRLDGIDTRLEGIGTRLDGMDTRFDAVEGRLDSVEGKLDEVLRRLPVID